MSGIVFLTFAKVYLRFVHFPSVLCTGNQSRLMIVFILFFSVFISALEECWHCVLSLTDKSSCAAKCWYFVLFLNSPQLVFNVWKNTFSHVFSGQTKKGKKKQAKVSFPWATGEIWGPDTRFLWLSVLFVRRSSLLKGSLQVHESEIRGKNLFISFSIAKVKGRDIFHNVATAAPTPWNDPKHRAGFSSNCYTTSAQHEPEEEDGTINICFALN